MSNLSQSLLSCSLPFHKTLPKTFHISSYNILLPHQRHIHTVFASSLKKTVTKRKVISNADLCKNILEFVSAFGFPEGHVPSTKELSQHGRQDLANIVRRRGYKMIGNLLATSKDVVESESCSGVVRDSTKDNFLEHRGIGDGVEDVPLNNEISGQENIPNVHGGNEANDVEKNKYAFSYIEHEEVGDVAKDYIQGETDCEQEDFAKDGSNLVGGVKDEEVGIVLDEMGVSIKEDVSLFCENEEPANNAREDFPLQTQNNVMGAVKNGDDDGIGDCDFSLQIENEVNNIDAFSSFCHGVEKEVAPNCGQEDVVARDVAKDIYVHSEENVPEADIHLDYGNNISSGFKSISSKSPDLKDDNVRKLIQDGEGKGKKNVARLEPLSCDSFDERTEVPKVVNGITTSSSRDILLVDSITGHPHQTEEFEHLRFMLHKKGLELTRLKKLIEKEQLALTTLQSETEIKIKEAQQLILEKDAELQAAEETLSDLQEVEIQFHVLDVDGEGTVVELAGSFNGWHHRVMMDQSPSSQTGKLRSELWTTVLWLYPGIYEIKFIVDGYWRLDPQRQVVTRGHIQNNILHVGKT